MTSGTGIVQPLLISLQEDELDLLPFADHIIYPQGPFNCVDAHVEHIRFMESGFAFVVRGVETAL